jgi:hypothetical protein
MVGCPPQQKVNQKLRTVANLVWRESAVSLTAITRFDTKLTLDKDPL